MARKYDASSIRVIEDDRERLRKRPLTYIPSRQKEGALSIFFEIVDNSIDELTVKDSVGSHIYATFDEKTKEMYVLDDGSGIPLEKLLDVCTIINSSGKFDNDDTTAYTYSGGLNGVGLKCQTYLSKYSEVKSIRGGKSLTYKFENGILTDTIEAKEKGHGTYVKWRLDPEFADPTNITGAELADQCQEKSYLFPDIHLDLDILSGGKIKKSYKFSGKGPVDWINKQKLDTPMFLIQNDVRTKPILVDINDENLKEQKVITNLCFGYKEDAIDSDDPMKYIISFGNTIRTTTGGTHVEGLKLGIQKYMKQQVIPNFRGKDKDLSVMPVDMTTGLCAFVWVQLATPDYRGQFKDQLNNPEAKYAVRDAVYDMLCDAPNSMTKQMVEFIKRVARGRAASKKTRKKNVSNAFSKDKPEKYKPIEYNINTVSPCLLLAEGDSAADLAASARDPHNQAIYTIKKPANVFDAMSDDTESLKKTFNDVLDICNIKPGKKCNPDDMTMSIFTLTDGDIDGDGISNAFICLLAKHCKPIIDAGKVGRILPPAYAIPTGKKDKNGEPVMEYVHTQREFYNNIMHRFIKKATVNRNGKELSKKEVYQIISDNFDYDIRINKLADRYCCPPKLIEEIAWNYHGDWTDQKKSYWCKVLKAYESLDILIEDGMIILNGPIPGCDHIHLAMDKNFDKHLRAVKKVQSCNRSIDGFSIDNESNKTLYDLLNTMRKYIPKGVMRFKGLGELSVDEMRKLCMDPETRKVIIFKFKDLESDMEKINIIMSTKKKYVQARTELVDSMTLSDYDLDT